MSDEPGTSDEPGLPPETGPERTCIVTRRAGPPAGLIRFVVGPDETVVADLRRRLPGRGAWVSADAATLGLAVKRKAFARAFKRPVAVADDLPAVVDRMLEQDALQSLALANKAGRLVCGSAKVLGALADGGVAALIHARDASPDGTRKIDAAARRFAGEGRPPGVVQIFESPQMDLALGRSNVIHAALLIGGASNAFLERAARLSQFRGLNPSEPAETLGETLPNDYEARAAARGMTDGGRGDLPE